MPRADCLERSPPLPSLKQEGQPHAEEYLTVRVNHAAEPGGRSPRLVELVELDVHDRVGEDERSGRSGRLRLSYPLKWPSRATPGSPWLDRGAGVGGAGDGSVPDLLLG